MSSDLYAPPQHVDLLPTAWGSSEAVLAPLGGRSMQDPASELPRIHIPRTSVNRCSRKPGSYTMPYDPVRLAPAICRIAGAPTAISEATLPCASTSTADGVPLAPKARPVAKFWS